MAFISKNEKDGVTRTCHPQYNGLTGRHVQTKEKIMRTCRKFLCVSFGAFLEKLLLSHQNTSRTRSKTHAGLFPGRNVRTLTAVIHKLCEKASHKTTEFSANGSGRTFYKKSKNTSWIKTETSERVILATDNQKTANSSDSSRSLKPANGVSKSAEEVESSDAERSQ